MGLITLALIFLLVIVCLKKFDDLLVAKGMEFEVIGEVIKVAHGQQFSFITLETYDKKRSFTIWHDDFLGNVVEIQRGDRIIVRYKPSFLALFYIKNKSVKYLKKL